MLLCGLVTGALAFESSSEASPPTPLGGRLALLPQPSGLGAWPVSWALPQGAAQRLAQDLLSLPTPISNPSERTSSGLS